jgi:transcriptional regulator with XRE-family HTH domain
MQLHEIIALMRKVKGWTQEEMAEQLAMSINGYSKIERGETSISTTKLDKLANIFGIESQDFFNFDGKIILNLVNFNDQSNSKALTQNNITNCQYELEKAHLMIEQKDKEIAYLKEILTLKETLLKQKAIMDQNI